MRKVLIVDDEKIVADTLTLIFGKNGFEARAAYSTDQAFTLARDFHPDLLLCDINMPNKDGFELIRGINATQPTCPVIVLSGNIASLRRAREHGADQRSFAVMAKPCQPADLLREAGNLLMSA